MNLAVHGLDGDIREANSFYDDAYQLSDGRPLWGHCGFVMANPPFNVDMVDAERVKGDRRLPFGLPGTSKGKTKKGQSGLLQENQGYGVQRQLSVDILFPQLPVPHRPGWICHVVPGQ